MAYDKTYGYLAIEEDVFKKNRNEAQKETERNHGKDNGLKTLTFSEGVLFEPDEITVESGKLMVCGTIAIDEKDLAYISLEIPIDMETAQDIVNIYLKQLNRLKTVMEAVTASTT